jgi:hypothetical protein
MLKSAGYEEGKLFHVIEDIEELKPIMKEALENMKDKESKKGFEKNNDLPIPPAIDSLKVSDRCH